MIQGWPRARVSYNLVTWKSLKPGESTQGRKSQWHIALRLQGTYHNLDASSWARGSLKAVACHQATCRVWMSLRSPIKQLLCRALSSFLQWGCLPSLLICTKIQLSAWSTGLGIHLGQGSAQMAAVGLAVVFGQAHFMWVGQHWWPLSHGSCGRPWVKRAEGWGASFCLSVAFPPRKLAGPWVMKVPHPNHCPGWIGPASALGLRVDTLPLVSAEKEGILWCAKEHLLSMSDY